MQQYRSNVTLSKAPSLSKTSSLRNTLKHAHSQHSASRPQETSGCSVDRSHIKATGTDPSLLSRAASKSSNKGLGGRKRSDCPLRALGRRQEGSSKGSTMRKGVNDLTALTAAPQPDSKGIAKKILKKLTQDLSKVGLRSTSRCKEGVVQPRLPAGLLQMNKENISTSFLERVSRLVGERKNDGLLKKGKKASR